MAYWTCPVDNFEAQNEDEKKKHLAEGIGDKRHQDMMKEESAEKKGEMKQKGKDFVEDIKDKVKDAIDKV